MCHISYLSHHVYVFTLQRSVFCSRMVHLVAMEMLPEERDRKYYQERYTCCPPPFFIICVTLLEVNTHEYSAQIMPCTVHCRISPLLLSATGITIVKNIDFMQPLTMDINLSYNHGTGAYKVITFYVPSAASIPAPVTSVN